MRRRGGIITFQIDGEVYDAKGNFTYNLGRPMNEAIQGADRIHGYRSTPQVAFIEGEITDRRELSLEQLVAIENSTITLQLANGKIIVLKDANFASEGTGNTEEGNIGVRFEGETGEEVRP